MGDDDHLVGAEGPQLVLECGGGVRVADFPTCHDLVFAGPGQRALEAGTRLRKLAVDVRHGVVHVRREHGREHVDLDVLAAMLKD